MIEAMLSYIPANMIQLCVLQASCFSDVTVCRIKGLHQSTKLLLLQDSFRSKPIPVSGGYIGIEFARDVELQTLGYQTTQENTIDYLRREYNTPKLVRDWGRPICMVNTGHHDAAVFNATLEQYLANVVWYLRLLRSQCESLIWLGTTAPVKVVATKKKKQTISLTKTWNDGVRSLLLAQTYAELQAVFVDVFDASLTWEHEDNIHLTPDWYQQLPELIHRVMQTKC